MEMKAWFEVVKIDKEGNRTLISEASSLEEAERKISEFRSDVPYEVLIEYRDSEGESILSESCEVEGNGEMYEYIFDEEREASFISDFRTIFYKLAYREKFEKFKIEFLASEKYKDIAQDCLEDCLDSKYDEDLYGTSSYDIADSYEKRDTFEIVVHWFGDYLNLNNYDLISELNDKIDEFLEEEKNEWAI